MLLLIILLLLILYYNKYLNNIENYSILEYKQESKDNNIVLDMNNFKNNQTIKSIYDELTNDNRLEYNLDNLEANNIKENYLINNRYGTTNFDTYSI